MKSLPVLVAEDNPEDFLLLQLAMKKSGVPFECARVADGMEAREYLKGQGSYADRQRFPLPCLILADLKMPRMNGLELLDWLRHQPHLQRIPYVLLTSSSARDDVNRAYDLHASSYLVKPSQFEDLISLLQSIRVYWLELNQQPELPQS
jgi:CheY-like chemotaxis protein